MNPLRKIIIGGSLAAATLTGGAIGAAVVNNPVTAATSQTPSTDQSTSSSSDGQATPPPQHDPSQGGHQANGITETLLTGDTAEKVKAAALQAVPGGTVERVENDAEGSPYEAHMTKSDGSHVTVKVDANFSVTGVEDGPGPR